jgi:small subunit ribosomal protein S4e
LQVLLRDVLEVAEKGKEARTLVKRGEILVDGKVRKDHAYSAGLFDVVSIPAMKKSYRLVPSKKGVVPVEISDAESKRKICVILEKTFVRGGKLQLNMHDGRNILVDKDDYKTGDSVLIELPSAKIVEHIRLEKGATGIVTRGADAGAVGKVKDIVVTATKEPTKIIYEGDKGEEEALKDRFFVIGKDKPLIKVSA